MPLERKNKNEIINAYMLCTMQCLLYRYIKERRDRANKLTTIYWYNPNIHPYMEYKARRDTLKEYAESLNRRQYLKKIMD